MRGPKTVSVKINLFFFELEGQWQPDDVQRSAAWELYVELATRISVVPLEPNQGNLREALNSLYSLFGSTRQILRHYGPAVARPSQENQLSCGALAVTVLNEALRPVLGVWHPALAGWEAQRPSDLSGVAHERLWPQADECRHVLAVTATSLRQYAIALADACDVPQLHDRTHGA